MGGVLGGMFSTAAPPMQVFHLYRQPLALANLCETLDRDLRGQWRLAVGGDGAESRLSCGGAVAQPRSGALGARTNLLDGTPPSPWPEATVRRVVAVLLVLVGLSSAGLALFSLLQALRCRVLARQPRHQLGRGQHAFHGAMSRPLPQMSFQAFGGSVAAEVHLAGVALGQVVGVQARRDDGRPQVVAVHAGEEVAVDDVVTRARNDGLLVGLGRASSVAMKAEPM